MNLELPHYIAQMHRNLGLLSRTYAGTLDTSSAPDKAGLLVTGLTGDKAGLIARSNVEAATTHAWQHRHDRFASPRELGEFIDGLAATVNQGIVADVKQGLIRTLDPERYGYTPAAQLEAARELFFGHMYDRITGNQPGWTPEAVAAMVEFHIDLTDHFYADGCAKSSKVISGFVLMRSGLPLPDYGKYGADEARKRYYAYGTQDFSGSRQESWVLFRQYYLGLF